MTGRDVVVIAGSAGGLEALRTLVGGVPADLAASIFVVLHTGRDTPGVLPSLLARWGPLPAGYARDGEAITRGRIVVAPPDQHLLVHEGTVWLTRGPREHGFRPAADPLFRSAARAYGPRVVGVVLSGGLSDGTHGVVAIKRNGGVAVVQAAEDAVVPSMPLSAMRSADIDRVLPAAEIGPLLGRLAGSAAPPRAVPASEADEVGGLSTDSLDDPGAQGTASGFTCPDCGGALWERRNEGALGFRCHVGHAFTLDSLAEGQGEQIEQALWTALRTLEESSSLRRRMAAQARGRGLAVTSERWESEARDIQERADVIRRVLLREASPSARAAAAAPAPPARRAGIAARGPAARGRGTRTMR